MSLEYTLAKELKDAGFPSPDVSDTRKWILGKSPDETVYCPDLSELIEACGRGYKIYCMEIGFGIQEEGKIPTMPVFDTLDEALALFWLSKNKKA